MVNEDREKKEKRTEGIVMYVVLIPWKDRSLLG